MRKIFVLLTTMLLLNGCAESVALLGTSVSGASNGKIIQSSLNSVITYGVKHQTGKTPLGHMLAYAEEKNPEKKKETCFSFIESTRSEFCTIAKKQISSTKTAVKERTLEVVKIYPKTKDVKLKKEKSVEEYKDLYHYVSLISGKLKDKVENIDIIKAMMPGGSVIGCPKISTLNLLNNQEKENRNIYTGSFGFIKFNGDMRFNIIIRSILNYKNISEISVASGVVIDSNAKHEFNENFIKAKALIDLYK